MSGGRKKQIIIDSTTTDLSQRRVQALDVVRPRALITYAHVFGELPADEAVPLTGCFVDAFVAVPDKTQTQAINYKITEVTHERIHHNCAKKNPNNKNTLLIISAPSS
jgi:hypothetical protein